MNSTKVIADVLQLYGGWGLSAILMTTVFFLFRHIKKQNEDRLEEQQEKHEQLVELLEQKIETDLKHEQSFKNLRKIIEILINRFPE